MTYTRKEWPPSRASRTSLYGRAVLCLRSTFYDCVQKLKGWNIFLYQGARTFLVGSGKGTRSPFAKITGLNRSSTDACMIGTLRWASMQSSKFLNLSQNDTSQILSLGIVQSLKPSKAS